MKQLDQWGNGSNGANLPRYVWIIYLILFSLSVPWWIPAGISMRPLWGLPLWLVTTIMAIGMIAVFTIYVIHFCWPEEGEDQVH